MGHYSPSPVIANGHLYLVSSRGTIAVVKTGDEFQIVHQAKLDEAVPPLFKVGLGVEVEDSEVGEPVVLEVDCYQLSEFVVVDANKRPVVR